MSQKVTNPAQQPAQDKTPSGGANNPGTVLGPTYEPGKPQAPDRWRDELQTREEMLNFVKTSLRYWYGTGYGSEKRRDPA